MKQQYSLVNWCDTIRYAPKQSNNKQVVKLPQEEPLYLCLEKSEPDLISNYTNLHLFENHVILQLFFVWGIVEQEPKSTKY